MKKYFYIALASVAAFTVLFSCTKAGDDNTGLNDNPSGSPVAGEVVTISATLSDGLASRVAFDPTFTANRPTMLALTWEAGDLLRVYNHEDRTQYSDFTLDEGSVGQNRGEFAGVLPDAESYDVDVIGSEEFNYNSQTQPADGVTSDLKYFASVTGITAAALDHIAFTEFNSILAITARMPSAEAAAAIKSVDITASEAIFAGANTLTITLETPGSEDDILNFFATLPQGEQEVAAGTTLLVHFNAPETDHTVYTRYIELGSQTFSSAKLNSITVNASKSDQHAGLVTADGTEADKAYLIADKYQLQAVNDLLDDDTRYFKLMDDIDLEGFAFSMLNPTSPYRPVDFDGNNKTISNLGNTLFYVLKGEVRNLTLDNCSVARRGILAEYIQESGNVVTNVNVSNSAVNTTNTNVGGLIGIINKGTGDSEFTATVIGCSVSNTDVTGAGVLGGVIGFANEKVLVSECSYEGGTVTSSASGRYVGGFIGSTGDFESVISDCSVQNATVDASARTSGDVRAGGFIGEVKANVQVKGCSVGTPETKVLVKTGTPGLGADNKAGGTGDNADTPINAGGFVGVNYGTITQNGSVRNQAYVKLTSTNTYGTPIDLGGFAGFHTGTIEYADAVVDMSELLGQYIGGFSGYIVSDAAKADHCTVNGTVKGNNYTGMFVGYVNGAAAITNNTAAGILIGQSSIGGFAGYLTGAPTLQSNSTSAAVTSNGTNLGGFVGAVEDASLTDCSSSGTVSKVANGNVMGGFVGYANNASFTNCHAAGTVDAAGFNVEYAGGFMGQGKPVEEKALNLENCYATGDVTGKGRWVGGFIGYIYLATPGSTSISKCYATGNVTSTGNYTGGFIGRIQMTTDVSIEKCYATGNVSSSGNYVSGFIGDIDGAGANHTISNCYSTGDLTAQGTRYRGGLFAGVAANPASVTVTNCYSTCEITGLQEVGGLVGRVNGTNFVMADCAAWNPSIVVTNNIQTAWSSGAVVGTTHPNCHISNTFRKPGMSLTVYCVPDDDFDQLDIDGTAYPMYQNSQTAPFTWARSTFTAISAGTGNADAGRWAYHGWHTTQTSLSTLASTAKGSSGQGGLGWSGDIWDFTGDLPVLK
ncbi:MAG: hypothetical protein J5764_06335 [Bacteroidales bacterium]|nr:hypothetical protein [Bacteroidales bacterium]